MFVHPIILTANSQEVRHIDIADNFQRFSFLVFLGYPSTNQVSGGTHCWLPFTSSPSPALKKKMLKGMLGLWNCSCPVKPVDKWSLPSFGGNAAEICLSLGCFLVLNYCIEKTQNSCPMFFAAGEKLCVFRPFSLRKLDSTDGAYQTSCYVSTWG